MPACILLYNVQYLDTTEMDGKMKDIADYINTYSKLMHTLTSGAQGLADAITADARIFKNFSEVCTAIAYNSEEEDGDDFVRQFGLSIGSFSVNTSRNGDALLVQVKEPLEQQERTLQSIKAALLRHKTLKNNFIVRAADKILCEKIEQKDPANLSKIEDSRNSRGAVLTAKQEYLDASGALLDNFESVQASWVYEVVSTAKSLCEVEVAACQKNGHVLADLLDELTD